MSDAVIIALIGAVVSIATLVVSVLIAKQVAVTKSLAAETKAQVIETHELTDGKMTKLIEATEGRAHAEGIIEGGDKERLIATADIPVDTAAIVKAAIAEGLAAGKQ